MKLSEDEVRYVAKLANLELSPEEISRFSSQLSHILEHMEALNEVSTGDIGSMMRVGGPEGSLLLSTPIREDSPSPSLGASKALINAPDSDGKYFKVPKVIADR